MPKVAHAMHLAGSTPRDVIRAVYDMSRSLGIPATLREAAAGKASEADFPALADLALHDSCMETNPIQPTREDVISVYRNAWEGRLEI